MIGLLDWLKIAAGACVGFLLAIIISVSVLQPAAKREAVANERAMQLARSMGVIKERAKTDDAINDLDTGALCRELGGEWMREQGVCH